MHLICICQSMHWKENQIWTTFIKIKPGVYLSKWHLRYIRSHLPLLQNQSSREVLKRVKIIELWKEKFSHHQKTPGSFTKQNIQEKGPCTKIWSYSKRNSWWSIWGWCGKTKFLSYLYSLQILMNICLASWQKTDEPEEWYKREKVWK